MSKDELIEARPDFLSVPEEERGLGDLAQYITPPRMKVIQPLAQAPYDDFEKGDVIITPQLIRLCDIEGEFHFTPVFFFAEWCLWNPLETKGMLPAIRERTLDPQDPMVGLSRDAKKRQIKCPEMPDKMMRYVEHLNFVIIVHDVDGLEETPIVLTYARGEHRYGSSLAALVRMRKAPLYGCVFQGTVGKREGPKGTWWGIDSANPEEDPWVSAEQFEVFKRLHAEYDEHHKARTVEVDYGDDASGEDVPTGDTGEF